jgi:hypothetical protein
MSDHASAWRNHGLTPPLMAMAVFMAAVAATASLALASCGGLNVLRVGSNCRTHGGLWYMKVQSVNALLFICKDGTVFRWDAND